MKKLNDLQKEFWSDLIIENIVFIYMATTLITLIANPIVGILLFIPLVLLFIGYSLYAFIVKQVELYKATKRLSKFEYDDFKALVQMDNDNKFMSVYEKNRYERLLEKIYK